MHNTTDAGIVIAVGNQKGGVGKTTNTLHIAGALGQRGYRCLVIDLDPAAGATKHLGVPPDRYAGTLELLAGDEPLDNLVLDESMPQGISLMPSRAQLCELDKRLSRFVDRTTILDRPLASARRQFDFVFLDTAPSAAAIPTVAAYASADWFLLSAFPHPLALAGLNEAFKDIGEVRKHRNPRLEVLGVVFGNVDGRATRLRGKLQDAVNRALPHREFHDHISQAVILPELSGEGRTLFQLPRYAEIPVAQQYLRLSAETQWRVRNRQAFLDGMLSATPYADILGECWRRSDCTPPLQAADSARQAEFKL